MTWIEYPLFETFMSKGWHMSMRTALKHMGYLRGNRKPFVTPTNEEEKEIMEVALSKAKNARMHILNIMNETISKPKEMSENAPAMKTFMVEKDKIKEIIGKGGAVIKSMQEETGATVDISDDGTVSVFAQTQSAMQACLEIIESIIEEPELNKIYKGTVVKIVDFGAFVNILPGKDGLLHISEISNERVEDVASVLEEGQEIEVKLVGFDRGKMKLSAKALIEKTD